jgi:hypothetical protein
MRRGKSLHRHLGVVSSSSPPSPSSSFLSDLSLPSFSYLTSPLTSHSRTSSLISSLLITPRLPCASSSLCLILSLVSSLVSLVPHPLSTLVSLVPCLLSTSSLCILSLLSSLLTPELLITHLISPCLSSSPLCLIPFMPRLISPLPSCLSCASSPLHDGHGYTCGCKHDTPYPHLYTPYPLQVW